LTMGSVSVAGGIGALDGDARRLLKPHHNPKSKKAGGPAFLPSAALDAAR